MTSAARRAAALILASSLLAACGGGADDRSRGDDPVSGGEVTAEAAPSSSPEPTTPEPTTPEPTPEPTGPTNLDELVAALQALPNVVSVEGDGSTKQVHLDAMNEETILAVMQMMSNEAEWTDSDPSVLLWGPDVGEFGREYLVHLTDFVTPLSPEAVSAFASLLGTTEDTELVGGPNGWELHATVPAALGTDWYPGFLAQYDAVRAAGETIGADPAASFLAVDFATGILLPEQVPLSLGDALQDPVWAGILEQMNATEQVLSDNESIPSGSNCDILDGGVFECDTIDPSIGTEDYASLQALEALRGVVEAAGYTFELNLTFT